MIDLNTETFLIALWNFPRFPKNRWMIFLTCVQEPVYIDLQIEVAFAGRKDHHLLRRED